MATLPMGQYAGTAYYSYDGVRKWRVWFVENGTKAWVLGWYGQFEIPEYKELPIQPATEEELNALTDAPPISDPWYIINRIREAEAAIPPEDKKSLLPPLLFLGLAGVMYWKILKQR